MIIKSLLDTDIYQYHVMNLVHKLYKNVEVDYKFYCRTPDVNLCKYGFDIKKEIEKLELLSLTKDEISFLVSLNLYESSFLEYLKSFSLNSKRVRVCTDTGKLEISIKGKWLETILFETFILSIINEIYSEEYNTISNIVDGYVRLDNKIIMASREDGFKLVDFGTRRRRSQEWHEEVVKRLSSYDFFMGTSNAYLAMKHNIPCIGTMSHQWIMAHQSLADSVDASQRIAFDTWMLNYRGKLGIALSDTLGMNKFLDDFDLFLANSYQGIRQDSGCPYTIADRIIDMYNRLGVDPKSKIIIFSDGLTIGKALDILDRYKGKINCVFGVGTDLTNDFMAGKQLQMVVKLISVNGSPVAKLSDSPGKYTCEDKDYLNKLIKEYIE